MQRNRDCHPAHPLPKRIYKTNPVSVAGPIRPFRTNEKFFWLKRHLILKLAFKSIIELKHCAVKTYSLEI